MINKQEVIEKIEACKSPFISEDDTIFNYGLDKALSIIKQLDEPEKPILIKEEAEWLEGLIKFVKSCGQSIYNTLYYITRQGYGYLFEYIDHDKDKSFILSNRIYPRELYPDDLKERFVNALLYGYEVEKDKLYTVELPNPNRADVSLMLGLYNDGKVAIFAAFTDSWKYEKQYKLTEAEIKEDFEWAWQFAEEVEND